MPGIGREAPGIRQRDDTWLVRTSDVVGCGDQKPAIGPNAMRFRDRRSVADINAPSLRWARGNQHLLHRLRYSHFVIRRKDDLQFFSPVCRLDLENKEAATFLMAHMKVFEPDRRNERSDSPKYCL